MTTSIGRKTRGAPLEKDIVYSLVSTFFGASDLSLRVIAQAIHRLGLVFASLSSAQRAYALPTTVTLILRTIDPKLYSRFVNGEVSDLDVVDAVFSRPGLRDLRHQWWGVWFEALIVLAAQEDEIPILSSEPINSPLLTSYGQLLKKEPPDTAAEENASKDPHRQHAEAVIQMVNKLKKDLLHGKSGIGFRHSVQRIELLSATLIEKQVEDASSDP